VWQSQVVSGQMVLHLIPEMAFLMEAGWMIGQTEVVDQLRTPVMVFLMVVVSEEIAS